MNRDEHRTYIRSSLLLILKESVSTINQLGKGMEFYAVSGQLLNSLFLQMTGAQEQKMKCICWELATNDLKYRYKRYYNGWSLNQCSTLVDKCKIYEDLMSAIKSKDRSYKLFANNRAKDDFRDEVYLSLTSILDGTNISSLYKKQYQVFKDTFSNISAVNITPSDKIFFTKGDKDEPIAKVSPDTELFAIYALLYEHRNRCAHNTLSYQLNLPHLNKLRDANVQKYDNIFLFIAVLIMIDEIFRRVFEKYESLEFSDF